MADKQTDSTTGSKAGAGKSAAIAGVLALAAVGAIRAYMHNRPDPNRSNQNEYAANSKWDSVVQNAQQALDRANGLTHELGVTEALKNLDDTLRRARQMSPEERNTTDGDYCIRALEQYALEVNNYYGGSRRDDAVERQRRAATDFVEFDYPLYLVQITGQWVNQQHQPSIPNWKLSPVEPVVPTQAGPFVELSNGKAYSVNPDPTGAWSKCNNSEEVKEAARQRGVKQIVYELEGTKGEDGTLRQYLVHCEE